VGDGRGTTLELLADAAQLGNELARLADGEVGLGDLVHGNLQLRRNERAAILAKVAFLVGVMSEVSIKIDVVEFHGFYLLYVCSASGGQGFALHPPKTFLKESFWISKNFNKMVGV
jgi:hypothetical protein